MVDTDTLLKYGTSFQTKCVVALLSDRQFLEQSSDIVDPQYFEGDSNRWIVDRTIWYYNQYRSLPTVEVLKKESDKLPEGQSVLRTAVVESLKSIFLVEKSNPEDLSYIKDEFLTFCKNQALKKAVLESADLLQSGRYEQIKSVIDKAMHAGQERNVGHIWLDELEARISKAARNVVPTPWPCINDIMDGGLGAGELGCVIAPSGAGKSWYLAALGAAAMMHGKTVVHYTFELSETYLGLRYDTIFTGIEPNKIRNHPDKVRKAMEEVNGHLIIKYFPARSVTINALRAHMEHLKRLGIIPDLIIVDYADLMNPAAKADDRTHGQTLVHEELRGLCGEYKIPGWTASQTQRTALGDDVVEADKIGGSYGKVQTDDFVISVSRKVTDKQSNTARTHVIKNRFGPDGITYPSIADLEHGQIEVFDENTPEGAKVKVMMTEGEKDFQKVLSQKFLDLQKKNPIVPEPA